MDGQASCYGKKIFATYWEAARNAKRFNRHNDAARMNPYHCDSCGHYHCGNTMHNKPYIRKEPRHGKRVKFTEEDIYPLPE